MKIKKRFFLEFGILVLVFLGVYFGNHYWQIEQGVRALESTNLRSTEFDQAKRFAEQTDQKILVEFAAIWCSTCRKVHSDVLSVPRVKDYIESNYIYSRVEWDEPVGRQTFQKYGIEGFPHFLVINKKGEVLWNWQFTLIAENFLNQLTNIEE